MQEVWRDIEGYGGFYQISSLGRVKSQGKQCAVSEKREIEPFMYRTTNAAEPWRYPKSTVSRIALSVL